MLEAKINFNEELINGNTIEEKEFNFLRILRGIFIDGVNLSNEINEAINAAYEER